MSEGVVVCGMRGPALCLALSLTRGPWIPSSRIRQHCPAGLRGPPFRCSQTPTPNIPHCDLSHTDRWSSPLVVKYHTLPAGYDCSRRCLRASVKQQPRTPSQLCQDMANRAMLRRSQPQHSLLLAAALHSIHASFTRPHTTCEMSVF
jgi:hypothetical protein